MIISKTLLITILWFLFSGRQVSELSKSCESFKVTHSLSVNGGSNSLELTITGGRAPYHTILSKENGELVTENFTQKRFESLPSGKYTCVVIDDQNCKRKLEISIP